MGTNQIYHVAAGTLHISKTGPVIAEAFLGSCVGVALFDAQNGVGGLSHFLLPDPVGLAYPPDPEKYVATGLPMFIHQILKQGAEKENLKAWVAGGALMEPLTRHDISLDIGGRNSDTAVRLLEEQQIPIEHMETGGFFTCTLRLDMNAWKPSIRPAMEISTSAPTVASPTEEQIEKALSSLRPIPQAALKAFRMLDEEGSSFKDIANEIRKDQVISANVLRICNSALFKGSSKIDTLDDALIILGRDVLVKSILLAAINNYFSQSGNGYALCYGSLYHHSVSSAVIAERIATVSGAVRPQTAYTAGLLHDIGMVVLDQTLTAAYPLFYRNMHEHRKNILSIEKQIFGTDHCLVGKKLAQKWTFPKNLATCIATHHDPIDSPRNTKLANIIFLTELIMSRFHGSLEFAPIQADYLESSLHKIGLSISDFPAVLNQIPLAALGVDPEASAMKKPA